MENRSAILLLCLLICNISTLLRLLRVCSGSEEAAPLMRLKSYPPRETRGKHHARDRDVLSSEEKGPERPGTARHTAEQLTSLHWDQHTRTLQLETASA